jgi:hypothetical protein
MSFIDSLQQNTNKQSYTANGALSNTSTLDPLLDFFSNAGAMRGRESDAVSLFNKAYAVDPTNAMRCLFYLRDVRGGQGERSVFRAVLDTLDEETVNKVAQYIPEYGRWDEVPFTPATMVALKSQLEADEANMKAGKPVSLLAKWLPSENTSSNATHRKAIELYRAWGLKASQYRKRVVALRKYIKLLEQSMSAREWAEIQYDKLPTQAHRKHIKAFKRHDDERYGEYLGKVEKGEAKINSSASFTYEIYDMVHADWQGTNERTANAMWKALPDYTNGQNALVLADVSGSMSGRPMSISVSLALYFAERNEGPFKDYFLTFTGKSRLQKITGNTLSEKMNSIERADWSMNTNLQSAFDAILKAAQDSNATADEMPKTLYIISDMQFDQATGRNDETNLEVAERKFREAGYELPHIVFWNANSYGDEAPATKFNNRVTLISGSNQSTFQYVVAGKTPMESMLDILNSDRYAQISV